MPRRSGHYDIGFMLSMLLASTRDQSSPYIGFWNDRLAERSGMTLVILPDQS